MAPSGPQAPSGPVAPSALELAGPSVADANVTATAKVQKQIIQDFLEGSNGREKKADWHPSYMSFPMKPYMFHPG